MRYFYLTGIVFLGLANKLFSQTIGIIGPSQAETNSTHTYSAVFDYGLNPSTTITWTVSGGTIIAQNTNPNSPNIYCTVQWGPNEGFGNITISESIDGGFKKLKVTLYRTTAVCETANAGPDVTLCPGGSALIGTPAVSGCTYSWSPASGLSNANIAQPTVTTPYSSITYTLRVTNYTSGNLIANHDFESGLTGFNTDYGIYPNGIGCSQGGVFGSVSVVSNPFVDLGYQYCDRVDHSINGNKMLFVDGSCTSNKRVWYQTVNVTPNTSYYFSGWAGNGSTRYGYAVWETAFLRLRINGVDLVQNWNNAWDVCNGWAELSATWNSGSATTALIEIYDDNLNSDLNDFCLDDLYFSPCPISTDNVIVSKSTTAPSVSPAGPITYYNQYETIQNHVVLTASGSGGYQWYKNNVAIPGATNQTYTINMNSSANYTEYYKCVTPCGTSNIVTLNYIACYTPGDYPTSVPGYFCASSSPTFTLTSPNLGSGTSYSWWTYNNPSNYTFSNQSGNTIQMSSSTYGWEGVYSKSSKSGQEIYMYYSLFGNVGCKIAANSNQNRQSINSANFDVGSDNIVIFPNPANTKFTIMSDNKIERVELYNMLGVLIKRIEISKANSLNINVTGMSPGLYSCKVLTNNGIQYLKLIVQK